MLALSATCTTEKDRESVLLKGCHGVLYSMESHFRLLSGIMQIYNLGSNEFS